MQEAVEATVGSVESLAEEIEVGPHTVWAWRAGRRAPGPENRRKLADALERRGEKLQELAAVLREGAED